MATKKTAAPKINPVAAVLAATRAKSAKPTKAPKAKPAPAVVAKAEPATMDDLQKRIAPKAKRTVALPENGLSGVPIHTVRTVAELAKTLGDFPRGSTFGADQCFGKGRIFIYNVRGKLIAEVRQGDKSAKAAKPKRTI